MTEMYSRLLSCPKSSFFLFGARGSGKSTWTIEALPDATRIDLLDERRYQDYLADISLFAAQLSVLPPQRWVVVDEVQRLPQLLNEVHRLIETRRLKFALTGSSARKLRRSGVNLLGGRALWRTMFPFSMQELGTDFALERALRFGTLPLVWAAEEPEEALSAYVQLYLKEEIKAEALVRNLPGFARFLPVVALCHGQVVNVSNLARDAGVARTTVEGFIEVMEDTLLINRLPAFEGRLRVKERHHPKIYWIDPGLARAAKRVRGDVTPEERGALLEGLVHMHLMMARDYNHTFDEFYYWAPSAGRAEVDFVLLRGKEVIAIEVKATRRLRPEHFTGLRAIATLRGLRRRVLVYLGDEKLRTEERIEVLPLEVFLDELTRL